jgi:membrane-associated phospholipid phosphatase
VVTLVEGVSGGAGDPPSGERSHTWDSVRRALTRPYRVTLPMVLLVAMVPFYLLIANRAQRGTVHAPAMALDRLLPVVPAWALVYGALYAFLIVLPVLVVQREDLIRRTVWAYLMVWSVAYLIFLVYPTVAPRPDTFSGAGFAASGLRFLYDADPPYNCFPSIHVAHSFVSAFACQRVHRGLGLVALACASLVALSTLFTRQHYVADLIAGILLAWGAQWIFLRGHPRTSTTDSDHRVAPALALGLGGGVGLGVVGAWLAFRIMGLS